MISVIIPTFNRAQTIGQAIDSVLEQTYRDIEVIVVDDGSTDDSERVFQRYGERITVIRQANAGPSAARNRGIAAAKGDVVAFLDSDDIWLPNKLERQAGFFAGSKDEPVCCICNARICDSAGRSKTSFELAGLNKSPAYGLFVNPFPVIATRFLLFNQVVAVRRETLQEVGGFNNELWLMEDYELALRLSALGPWGVVREPLVIKDNTTGGIGVKAMRTQEKQLPILVNMIRHFLSEDHSCLDRDLHVLRRRLRRLEKALFASHLARPGTRHDAFVGKLRLAFLRCWRRAERKLPTWPKPKFAEFPERKQPAATEAQPIELR